MIGMNILYAIWCLWLFIALGVTADAFFVPTLTKISTKDFSIFWCQAKMLKRRIKLSPTKRLHKGLSTIYL